MADGANKWMQAVVDALGTDDVQHLAAAMCSVSAPYGCKQCTRETRNMVGLCNICICIGISEDPTQHPVVRRIALLKAMNIHP